MRLLNGALSSPKVAQELSSIGMASGDLSLPGLRALWMAIEQQRREQGTVSRSVVGVLLAGTVGEDDAAKIMSAVGSADPLRPGEDAAAMVDHMRRRVAVRRLTEIGKRLWSLDEKSNPIEAASQAVKDIEGIASAATTLQGVNAARLAEIGRNRTSQKRAGIPLGLGPIDTALGGGAPRGAVTLFATGSGKGKTTFARHSLLAALRAGHTCALITFESDREETSQALLEMIAGCRMPPDGEMSRELSSRFMKAGDELERYRLWVEDPVGGNVEQVCSVIRTLAARGVTFFELDYIQDILPSPQFNRHDFLSHIHVSRSLRGVTREENVALVALSQIGTTDGKQDAEAVAGSRQYFKDSKAAVSFERDTKSKHELKQNVNRVSIQKNRLFGKRAEAFWRYDIESTRLHCCDAEGRDIEGEASDGR